MYYLIRCSHFNHYSRNKRSPFRFNEIHSKHTRFIKLGGIDVFLVYICISYNILNNKYGDCILPF